MQFEYKGKIYSNGCSKCKFLYIEEDMVYCIHMYDPLESVDKCTLYQYYIDISRGGLDSLLSVTLPMSTELFKSKYTELIKPYEYSVVNNFITDILEMGIDSNIILF